MANQKQQKTVLIVAGGTGGHIFPALAVANQLHKQSVCVHWLGSRSGMERQLVSPHYPISYLAVKGVRGNGLLAKLITPFYLTIALMQALWVIKKYKPNLVLGMGGFASGPGGIAAHLSKIPLIIHEQNSIAGFTNKKLAKYAKIVLQAYPKAFSEDYRPLLTGNPVREEIFSINIPAFDASSCEPMKILVLGGSQGAHSIDQTMVSVMEKLNAHDQDTKKKLSIWHQTRPENQKYINEKYRELNIDASVSPFIEDMASAYSWADLIISRAGALSCAEIAAAGRASILIPYPFAVDNHQLHNGSYLAQAGAAKLIPQNELNVEKVMGLLKHFVNNRNELVQMAKAAKHLAKPNALQEIVDVCLKTL